eukprot:27514-Eustigmatos_ZCMA.PRE.1
MSIVLRTQTVIGPEGAEMSSVVSDYRAKRHQARCNTVSTGGNEACGCRIGWCNSECIIDRFKVLPQHKPRHPHSSTH